MQTETSDPGRADEQVAARLRQSKSTVLDRWSALVREHCTAAAAHDELALQDSLPDIIETIAAALDAVDADAVLDQRGEQLGEEHGRERARLGTYDLEQLVDEYRYFRQALFAVLEEAGPVDSRARDIILEAVQRSIRASAVAFTQRSAAEREESAAALRVANELLTTQLGRTEERFRMLVDGVTDYAIFTMDKNGHVTSWNSGAQRMKGYTSEEILGRHYSLLYTEDGRRRDEPNAHLRTAALEGRFRGEGVRQRKSGEHYIADVLITPMREGDQLVGFSKVVQDLTERNVLMQERDLSRTNAERLQIEAQYRDRFVSTLTHDLRTPIAAAVTAANLVASQPTDVERVVGWAARITQSLERADKMIGDLLDATKMQTGEKLHLELAPCDMRALVDAVHEDHAARCGDRFRVEVKGETRGVWSCEQLQRVLDNLIANAIKYGEHDSSITTRLTRVEDRLLVAVHNEGTIIPPEDQKRLFEPFHRTEFATKSGKTGWGLGLALVRGIVEAHGGIVKVESYPKEGTTFTIDLPVDASVQPALPSADANDDDEVP